MSKDPTPNADRLRAQREARFGHLQATAEPGAFDPVKAMKPTMYSTAPVLQNPKKLIPYAGKAPGGRDDLIGNKNAVVTVINKPGAEVPFKMEKPARKRRKLKRTIA